VQQQQQAGIAMRPSDPSVSVAEDSFGEFSPAIIMSQEKHFQLIFELLSHSDPRVVAASWRLLDHLPAAPALRGSFSEPAPDFSKLLQIGSSYRLVYSLQVLENLCQQATVKSKTRVQMVKSGVVNALERLLLHNCTVAMFEDASPAIRLLCVRIIHLLILDEDSRSAFSSVDSVLTTLAEALKCVALRRQTMPEDVETSARIADTWSVLISPKVNLLTVVPDFDEWLKNVLLHAISDQIRAHAQRCLMATCHEESYNRLVLVLADLLPEANKWGPRAVQLMALLESFARLRAPDEHLAAILPIVSKVILERPIVEESIDSGNEDWSLCAMLSLLAAVLASNQKLKSSLKDSFLPHLFWDCLFALPDAKQITEKLQPPKCKTSMTRATALRLLTELCRGCPENYLVVTGFVWKQGKTTSCPWC
jgi:hypothetical protein